MALAPTHLVAITVAVMMDSQEMASTAQVPTSLLDCGQSLMHTVYYYTIFAVNINNLNVNDLTILKV